MQLEAEGVAHRYTRNSSWLFDGLDFSATSGKILAITGPSGCGKSTLLDIIGGLRKPVAGKVYLDDGVQRESLRDVCSWIAQSTPVLGGRTAVDNVAIAMFAQGLPLSDARRRAKDALSVVGLEARATAQIGELSGGEVQRISVARCLISRADVILADEPTGQLDGHNTALVIEALQNASNFGKVVVIATHDPWVVSKCSAELQLRNTSNYA